MYIRHHQSRGFTLIELMIALAIIAVIASVAIPAYNGYIHNARMTEGADSITALKLAQTEFFQENNFFFTGGNTAALITNSSRMWIPTPWDPTLTDAANLAKLNFTYTVANCVLGAGSPGATDTTTGNPTQCYTVTATGQNMLTASDILTASN